MDRQTLAEEVVNKMMAQDAFSRWLGISITDTKPGYVQLEMNVREEMMNGFRIAHGGIPFALADSALAFAANSHGRVALTIENNISFLNKVMPGETLTATADELFLGNRTGVYNITITNQNNDQAALFRGTVFRTREQHFDDKRPYLE